MIGEALDHAFGVFTKIFATVAIIAAVAILYIILTWNSGKEIVSEHPLKPEKRLVIKNNKVDTLYVYKKP